MGAWNEVFEGPLADDFDQILHAEQYPLQTAPEGWIVGHTPGRTCSCVCESRSERPDCTCDPCEPGEPRTPGMHCTSRGECKEMPDHTRGKTCAEHWEQCKEHEREAGAFIARVPGWSHPPPPARYTGIH